MNDKEELKKAVIECCINGTTFVIDTKKFYTKRGSSKKRTIASSHICFLFCFLTLH